MVAVPNAATLFSCGWPIYSSPHTMPYMGKMHHLASLIYLGGTPQRRARRREPPAWRADIATTGRALSQPLQSTTSDPDYLIASMLGRRRPPSSRPAVLGRSPKVGNAVQDMPRHSPHRDPFAQPRYELRNSMHRAVPATKLLYSTPLTNGAPLVGGQRTPEDSLLVVDRRRSWGSCLLGQHLAMGPASSRTEIAYTRALLFAPARRRALSAQR
jgi:hypothetical protein